MNLLSVFSGIGLHDLGLELAGFQIVGQIEIDPWCHAVLERHWPSVNRWTDICEVTQSDLATLGPIDLISGGFPCQDISVANNYAEGLHGKQSGLWFELLRIIRILLPSWLLIENVPSLRTRGIDTVISSLEEEGYTCWPFVVGAWAAGAPHRRNRVWIVAYSNSSRVWLESGRGQWEDRTSPLEPWFNGQKWPARRGQQPFEFEPRRTISEPKLGGESNGCVRGLDRFRRQNRLKALGNANPPHVPYLIGRSIRLIESGDIDLTPPIDPFD